MVSGDVACTAATGATAKRQSGMSCMGRNTLKICQLPDTKEHHRDDQSVGIQTQRFVNNHIADFQHHERYTADALQGTPSIKG